MKIDKTVILEEKDIFNAIKEYLATRLAIPKEDVCSFQLKPTHPDHDERKDTIMVIIRQETV